MSYVLRFESLAIFRASTHSTLPLPTVQSLCELRLLTEDGLGVTHYLSGCRKHFIVQGGKSPGRLVEPGAKQHKRSNILAVIIFIIQTKAGSPRARLGAPKSWFFNIKGSVVHTASAVKPSKEICIPWPLCLLAGVIPLACSGLLSVDQVVGIVAQYFVDDERAFPRRRQLVLAGYSLD